MRPVWMLAAMVCLVAGPVMAQGLIPPSRQYSTPKREGMDKSYGLPTFGTASQAMPKQETMAPKDKPREVERPDAFKPMPSFARPDVPPAGETPDFFEKPAGLASSATSGVPNFFQDTPDPVRPKAATRNTGETPLFTTGEGFETGDTPTNAARPGATPDPVTGRTGAVPDD
jgi:hypothetical protein